MTKLVATLLLSGTALASIAAQSQDQHAQMMARGEHAMGFDQDKTTHHFYLHEDGGAIHVTVKDQKDRVSLEAIRSHLPYIAKLFASGDFSVPGFIHDQAVPGSEVMKQHKDRIAYVYEDTADGGRVRITTRVARAVMGVHEFLRFQITDHKTGDSLDVSKAPNVRFESRLLTAFETSRRAGRRGRINTATSEAEPHGSARGSEAEPR
jgi:hypothetical protein